MMTKRDTEPNLNINEKGNSAKIKVLSRFNTLNLDDPTYGLFES